MEGGKSGGWLNNLSNLETTGSNFSLALKRRREWFYKDIGGTERVLIGPGIIQPLNTPSNNPFSTISLSTVDHGQLEDPTDPMSALCLSPKRCL